MKLEKKPMRDYGLFCFRLNGGERDELNDLVDKVKERLNKNRKADEYAVTKSQILYEAIKLGLPLVMKRDR